MQRGGKQFTAMKVHHLQPTGSYTVEANVYPTAWVICCKSTVCIPDLSTGEVKKH